MKYILEQEEYNALLAGDTSSKAIIEQNLKDTKQDVVKTMFKLNFLWTLVHKHATKPQYEIIASEFDATFEGGSINIERQQQQQQKQKQSGKR